MKKSDDEVTVPPSNDEDCVSGLIGSVLTLIISILVWLQKIGFKNVSGLNECADACELLPTLEKLSLFARQTDEIGVDGSGIKSCSCTKNKKDKREKSDKNLKKAKSGESNSVLYAVGQDSDVDPECKKCCRKVVEPKGRREDDNVIFEVVAAQMVENQTQTNIKEFIDNFTQPDQVYEVEKEADATTICICSSTQMSKPDVTDNELLPKVETKDVGVQVEIEIKRSLVKNIDDETSEILPPKDSGVKFRSDEDTYVPSEDTDYECSLDDDDDDDEDLEREDDEEDYEDGEPEVHEPCPNRCVAYIQARPLPAYPRQAPFNRGQPPPRQERPSYYPAYETRPVYKQYDPGYNPYAPSRYPYQPQPYYHKITRTIQRGPVGSRKVEYQCSTQRQISPTQRTKLSQDSQPEFRSSEKFSQSEAASPSPSPVVSPRVSKNDSTVQREQTIPKDKECVPHCPGSKPGPVRKLSTTPVSSPMQPTSVSPKPHSPIVKKECDPKCPKSVKPVTEKSDVAKTPSKKCVARCANPNKSQSKTNSSQDSKQKPRPVSFMPKGAIPVESRDVLEVEQAPASKQEIVADSVMSVEASKRNK